MRLKTRVVNVHREDYDVYIGRGNRWLKERTSPWANHFVIGEDGDRAEVIAKYEAWLREQPDLLARLPELRGKRLGCWCSPLPCHGDVLVKLIEEARDG